jgi:subtilisin family serine protease
MSAVWKKIDPGLALIYSNYLQVRDLGPETVPAVHPAVRAGGRVLVLVVFTTELVQLEALGFELSRQEDEHRAIGVIDLAELERLANHDGVQRIAAGTKGRPTLDRSIPAIRASMVRALAGEAFFGATGAEARVAIIDTGIDFRHPFFLSSTSPPTTRIRRIWDQGLVPEGTETSPDPKLLESGRSYGVEYTDDQINAVLRKEAGAEPVRHRDCMAHGTHVASIAAGDGRPKFTYAGVAPEAELIVVKHIGLETHPVSAGFVTDMFLFRDAVSYVLKVADKLDKSGDPKKPVAINCSFSNSIGPHDGCTEDEDWLTFTFSPTEQFSKQTIHKGKVLVMSAGNEGGESQHAQIDFPGADEVEIPLLLTDDRTNRRDHDFCRWENSTYDLRVDLWYEAGGAKLSAELDIPYDEDGYIAGPALGEKYDPKDPRMHGTFGGRTYDMYHSQDTDGFRGKGGSVTRNLFQVVIGPYKNRHRVGPYMLKVKSEGKLTAHLWCEQETYGFKIGESASRPSWVKVVDKHQIGQNAGAANIVTVAAHSTEPADSYALPTDPVVKLSSRGPLVAWGTQPRTQPKKPDIAAPGYRIDAAKGRNRLPFVPGRTIALSGTSMSAPHVTGAIALLLEKNPELTVDKVLEKLRKNVSASTPKGDADDYGAGWLDVKNLVEHAKP